MDDNEPLLRRRQTLKLLAGAGVAGIVGFGATRIGSGGGSSSNGGSTATTTSTTAGGGFAPSSNSGSGSTDNGDAIPEETAGPYPSDGSNGVNVLTQDGVVRRDIRSSFGSASGVADGVPLTIELTVTDVDTGDPIPGAAVYVWHCDREGQYSMYSQAVVDENYLRGVQEADESGKVSFLSIFPACYSGRWPHVHFEVYPSVDEATVSLNTKLATSQMALPAEVCQIVYATDGYSQSVSNLSRVSLDSDMVFSDSYPEELATVTGDVDNGYVASLAVPV